MPVAYVTQARHRKRPWTESADVERYAAEADCLSMISLTLGGFLLVFCCCILPSVVVIIMLEILTPKILAILIIPLALITGARRLCPMMYLTAGVCWVELALLFVYFRFVLPNVDRALASLYIVGIFLFGMYNFSRAVGKPVILCFLPCERHFKRRMPVDDADVMHDLENDLVSAAPARSRAWRRRGWLIMIRARAQRRAPRLLSRLSRLLSSGRSNNTIVSCQPVEQMDLRYVVMRLAEMRRSDIFRRIVAFI